MKSLKDWVVGAAATSAPTAEDIPVAHAPQTTEPSDGLTNHSSLRVGERRLTRPDQICYVLIFAALAIAAFLVEVHRGG